MHMKDADFSKYSLALIFNGRKLFSSNQHGISPLVVCINTYQSCVGKCILHDKVVGLAAARLISNSKMISSIVTQTISCPAKNHLERYNIEIKADAVVDNILTADKQSICPAELIAMNIHDDQLFMAFIKDLIRNT